MVRLSAKVTPREATPEKGLQKWLEKYLQDIYEKGEEWGSEAWRLAREWDEDAVRDIVRNAGLGVDASIIGRDRGGEEDDDFVVMGEEELELQIRWRKEDDWRAGSTPLGRPARLDSVEQSGNLSSCPVPHLATQRLGGHFNLSCRTAETSWVPPFPRQVQRGDRRRWRRTIGAQRLSEVKAPSSWREVDTEEEEEPSHKPNETKLDQPQDSVTGEVCTEPFGYFGYQGWTEMTQ
ncbi:hypothetical protein ONS95_003132 [Cadophora gregata]|uniref:uncharacterized protein n=1 Tax=Cadophora gregata TaxID=51156 RepID=UPI0026DA9BCC|nr:uncharacterized protein ONS95_003132 [Cadophora gregata]KAK0108316.1 hypothetical protein ONS95_003132 [Cadophora gregata]KAK0109093.1 hypothetical protein ONS96_002920 [Cadophora gregata f. sp. sojae]